MTNALRNAIQLKRWLRMSSASRLSDTPRDEVNHAILIVLWEKWFSRLAPAEKDTYREIMNIMNPTKPTTGSLFDFIEGFGAAVFPISTKEQK